MNSHLWNRERELNAPKITKHVNPSPFDDVKETSKHINNIIRPVYKMNEQTEYKKTPIKNNLYELPKQVNLKPLEPKQYNNKISTINRLDNNISKYYGSKKF